MFTSGILGTLSGFKRRRRLLIFTFHRVLDEPDPMLPDEPSVASFEEQLRWITELLNVIPLTEAVERLASNDLDASAACITFDDGYRNNYTLAAPVLNGFGVPATFFIATGVEREGAMWNDLVIESVRACRDELDLRDFGFGTISVRNDVDRARALEQTLGHLKYLPLQDRTRVAREIFGRYVGSTVPPLMMSPDMWTSLIQQGHEVGAHTVSHPILSNVDDERAWTEICDSRDHIASVTGIAPKAFAYPNGRPGRDFCDRHREMVQRAGFDCAVSTTWGAARPSADRFTLPRISTQQRTRQKFFLHLAKTYLESYY